jgi:hypothetical protein
MYMYLCLVFTVLIELEPIIYKCAGIAVMVAVAVVVVTEV